jgi:hypothetical protein
MAFLRGLYQSLSNVLARFMIAAVRQMPAGFFQRHIHVRGSSFVNLCHFAPDQ